ncbi:MAG: tRNA pseudouridine(55) synthase TruB [Aureliella sp.]
MRSGLLVINKPAGISSRDCVNRVQKAAGDRKLKVGHAGTLDPMATGVLLVVVGEATRLVEQLHDLDKSYRADFQFGKSSDTLDIEGEIVLHPDDREPTREELEQACQSWTGQVMQRPPRYSAIKIQGQRAYDLARKGTEFEPEARPVAIHALTLTRFDYPDWSLDIHCGSGTYVRSIGRDVAEAVGNHAIMTGLVRTAIGPFRLEDAWSLEELTSPESVDQRLRSPLDGLPGWPRLLIDDRQVQALRHGQRITLATEQRAERSEGGELHAGTSECLAIDRGQQLVAFIEVTDAGQARPLRVFQTTMATSQPNSTRAKHSPES